MYKVISVHITESIGSCHTLNLGFIIWLQQFFKWLNILEFSFCVQGKENPDYIILLSYINEITKTWKNWQNLHFLQRQVPDLYHTSSICKISWYCQTFHSHCMDLSMFLLAVGLLSAWHILLSLNCSLCNSLILKSLIKKIFLIFDLGQIKKCATQGTLELCPFIHVDFDNICEIALFIKTGGLMVECLPFSADGYI